MRILFTGSSSFTGYWFIQALMNEGHEVIATFRNSLDSYVGVRSARTQHLRTLCDCRDSLSFGSEKFLTFIDQEEPFDLFCHHAAEVKNYKSADFDPLAAVAVNTHNLDDVLNRLEHKGCHRLLLTGSVFEQHEGIGSSPAVPFSPYGLSKGLTSDFIRYYCERRKWIFGKFTIPNPFGPYEEERLTHYLIHQWLEDQVPVIHTPSYIRDNIHVSLLAAAYAQFAQTLSTASTYCQLSPSQYTESQGAFVMRVSQALQGRIDRACAFETLDQVDFSEPKIRINKDPINLSNFNWSEEESWDALAYYYSPAIRSL